jgi:hypothetical protein
MGASVRILSREDVKRLSVVQDSSEIIGWKLYDTVFPLNAGTQREFTFFQQAIGQGGITPEVTNMTLPSQLPSGHQFVAMKGIVEAFPSDKTDLVAMATILEDVYTLTHAGYVEFTIGGRLYSQEPIKNWIGGHLFGFAASGNASEVAYAQGRAVVTGELDPAITIPSTFNFSVKLTYPVAPVILSAVKVNLRVQLVGKLIRPRQG